MTVGKIGRLVFPMIGMMFFWRYLRFQTFVRVIYPLSLSVDFFGISIHISLIFLAELVLLGMVSLAFREKIQKVMSSRRVLVLIFSFLGSCGAIIALSAGQNLYHPVIIWLSSILIALGFITNYLTWASYFSEDFGSRNILVLALSYLISLALFPAISLFVDITESLTIITPTIVGLAWFVLPSEKKIEFDVSFNAFKSVGLYVPLFIVFLVAGSAIRGIVDIGNSDEYLRWGISLGSGALIFAAFWYFCGFKKPLSNSPDTTPLKVYTSVSDSINKSWIILVFLFLLGLFLSWILPHKSYGGELVVVARSFLDFFLWILLCNLSSHKRISPLSLFIVCGIFVEAISWAMSYVVVPLLVDMAGGEGVPLQNNIVLVVVFVLFTSVTIVFGFVIRRLSRKENVDVSNETHTQSVPDDIAKRYKLTKREVEIVNLFVEGRSLRKVAAMLFISQSTAQSHIKSVYRKLDIHTKDDLVDLLIEWNAEQAS